MGVFFLNTVYSRIGMIICLYTVSQKTSKIIFVITTTNNNNKRICIAQVCQMTSEALGGQLQSCYTARARPKCLTEEKCSKTTLEQSS